VYPSSLGFIIDFCPYVIAHVEDYAGAVAEREAQSRVEYAVFAASSFPILQNSQRVRMSRYWSFAPLQSCVKPVQQLLQRVGSIEEFSQCREQFWVCESFADFSVFHDGFLPILWHVLPVFSSVYVLNKLCEFLFNIGDSGLVVKFISTCLIAFCGCEV